jgi:hypothetical protein
VRRRSSRAREAGENWARFLERNADTVRAAGLPSLVTATIAHWDDLLMHGRLAHHTDPAGFTVAGLSDDQYAALVVLADSYFTSGYEYFVPKGLRVADQQSLSARHGPP